MRRPLSQLVGRMQCEAKVNYLTKTMVPKRHERVGECNHDTRARGGSITN